MENLLLNIGVGFLIASSIVGFFSFFKQPKNIKIQLALLAIGLLWLLIWFLVKINN